MSKYQWQGEHHPEEWEKINALLDVIKNRHNEVHLLWGGKQSS